MTRGDRGMNSAIVCNGRLERHRVEMSSGTLVATFNSFPVATISHRMSPPVFLRVGRVLVGHRRVKLDALPKVPCVLPSFAATNELEARRGYNGAPNCPVLHLFSREVLAKPGRSPMVTPRCCTDGDCGSSSQHLAGAETSLRGEGEIHRGRACNRRKPDDGRPRTMEETTEPQENTRHDCLRRQDKLCVRLVFGTNSCEFWCLPRATNVTVHCSCHETNSSYISSLVRAHDRVSAPLSNKIRLCLIWRPTAHLRRQTPCRSRVLLLKYCTLRIHCVFLPPHLTSRLCVGLFLVLPLFLNLAFRFQPPAFSIISQIRHTCSSVLLFFSCVASNNY